MNRVLVTGVSGQVGSAVGDLLQGGDYTVVAPGRDEMNLADAASIRRTVERVAPRWIVSCAAYTAVDAAETDREAAYAANATAPGVLAEAAAAAGAGLIHFSTDYVFNGSGSTPWVETDATDPLNEYGASKLAGEQAIAQVAASTGLPYAVLRTSWVYSPGGKNFVRTMLRLLSTRTEPLRIVADQHGAPTAASDLADAVAAILRSADEAGSSVADGMRGRTGVYHCAGGGETTWAGLADAVREYLQAEEGLTPPSILPVPSSEYPTPAARPRNSRLHCGKIAADYGVRLPEWRESVQRTLRQLAALDLQQLPKP